MHIETVLEPDPAEQMELPWQTDNGHYLDLRSNLRSIYQIEAARRHPPLGRFLATVNSEDSVFATATCHVEGHDAAGGTPAEFSSRIALLFVRDEFNFEARHLAGLIGQLVELLDHEDRSDSLAATLRIGPCRFTQLGRDGFHLVIQLAATGDTAEQAELRWGLGLIRVQQALLFLSRVVRQHLSSGSSA